MQVMRRIGFRSVLAHRVRLLLTLLSVAIGTSFMTGSAMFTAQLENSFTAIVSSLFDEVDVAATGGPGAFGLDAEKLTDLRSDPRISHLALIADPSTVAVAYPGGGLVDTGGAPAQALAVDKDGHMFGADRTFSGRLPSGDDEIIINAEALSRANLNIGDQVVIVGDNLKKPVTIVGSYTSSGGVDTGGWLGAVFAEDTYVKLFGTDGKVQLAAITLNGLSGKNSTATSGPFSAAPDTTGVARGSDEAQALIDPVVQDLTQQFPEGMIVPGKKIADQTTAQLQEGLTFVRYFLWAFAGIALLVAMFLISNTFAMIVAQRTREFALLRAVGASAGQITLAVTLEATVIGLLGSAAGIAGGIGLVKMVTYGMQTVNVGLPMGGMILTPTALAAPLIVGTLLTMIAGFIPARRAGRIPPVAAMSDAAHETDEARDGISWRSLFGLLLVGIGAALVAGPVYITIHQPTKILAGIVGGGAAAIIIGVWLAGPVVATPPITAVGRLIGKPFGTMGRLAAGTGHRWPKRTAATAFALTLGLLMVTTIGMLGATMKASLTGMIEQTVSADLVIKGPTGSTLTIPEPYLDGVTATPPAGTDRISVLRTASLTVAGQPRGVPGGRPNSTNVADLNFDDPDTGLHLVKTAGSLDLSSNKGVIIDTDVAAEAGVDVGDTIAIGSKEGQQFAANVTGIYEPNTGLGQAIIATPTAAAIVGDTNIAIQNIFVTATSHDDTAVSDLKQQYQQAADDYLVVDVLTRGEFAGEGEANVDQLLNVLYGLLTLAVITAILGIINTLGLSVVERRTEIGMLRVVGTQRRQISTMIYLESAAIALVGAILGEILGVFIGWGFLDVLRAEGVTTIAIPTTLLIAMLPAAGLIGVIAAAWPAHRAAGTPPLAAIVDD